MNDWSRTQELMRVAEDSAGTGARQLALSLDSIETKVNKLKATWQEFTYNFLNSDMVKTVLDGLNSILKFTTEILNSLNQLPGILGNIIFILTALAIKSVITSAIGYGKAFFEAFKVEFNKQRMANAPKDVIENAIKGAQDGTAYGTAYAKAVEQAKQAEETKQTAKDIGKTAMKAGTQAGVEAGAGAVATAGASGAGTALGAKLGAGFIGKAATAIAGALPYIAIATAVIAGIAIIVKSINSYIDKKAKEAGERVDSAMTKINETLSETKNVSDKYNEAMELQSKGVLRTAEETENYQSILNDLKSIYPDFVNTLSDGTLELNKQSGALEKYNEKAKEQIALQYRLIDANKQGAIKAGVMVSQTGLDAQSRVKNTASQLGTYSKEMLKELGFSGVKDTDFSKMAEGGLGYESAKDFLGVSNADEYYKYLEFYTKNKKLIEGLDLSKNNAFAIPELTYQENGVNKAYSQQILNNLQALDKIAGEGTVVSLYDEQFRLAETYADTAVDFYANSTGGVISEALKKGLADTYKDSTYEEIDGYAKEFYTKLSNDQQKLFNEYVDEIGTTQKIGDKDNTDTMLRALGISKNSNIGKAMASALNKAFEERNKKIEEYSSKYSDLTGQAFIKENYSDLTMEQLNQLMTQIATISEEYGQESAQSFEKAYRDYTNLISASPELVSQFASVDLNDVQSIADYASQVAVNIGESSETYKGFIELVNNSSNILDRSFKTYEQWTGNLKKDLSSVKDEFDNLSSAAEGKLGIEDAFTLISNSSGALDLKDFYATADGLGLSAQNITKAQKIIVEQKKISLQLQLEQYKINVQSLTDEIEKQADVSAELYRQYQLKAATLELTKEERVEYEAMTNKLNESGQMTNYNQYASRKKVIESIPTAIKLLDQLSVPLKKTTDKTKKLKDAWKELLDWLEKIDKYSAVDSYMEMLESDITKYDFNIEFSTNVDEITQSTIDKVNAMNQLVNANIAKSKFAEESAQSFRAQLEGGFSKYVSFDQYGNLIENIKEIEQWGYTVKDLVNSNEALAEGEKTQYEALLDLIDKYREERKLMRDTEQTAKDYVKQLKELNTQQLENIKKVEDTVLKLLQERDQKVIDNLKERYDFMKKQDQDYLDSVKEAIDKERKLRDTNQDYEDLARQERKLQLLKMSGGSPTEIQNLEQEIAKSRQDLADKEVDNLLDELNQEQEIKQQKMDAEVDYLQQVQDAKVAVMTEYNIEVRDLMSKSTEEFMTYIKTLDDTYITGTQVARKLWEQEMKKSIASAKAGMEYQVNPAIESVQGQVESLVKKQGLSRDTFEVYANTVANSSNGLVSNVQSITDTYLRQKDAINAMKDAYTEYLKVLGQYNAKLAKTSTNPSAGGTNEGLGKTSSKKTKPSGADRADEYDNRFDKNRTTGKLTVNGMTVGTKVKVAKIIPQTAGDGNFIFSYGDESSPQFGVGLGRMTRAIKVSQINGKAITDVRQVGTDTYFRIGGIGWIKSGAVQKYAKGGLVDYTGPAWVDGTKSNPEAFLSSKDTANIASLTNILSRVFSNVKLSSISPAQSNGDVYYQISINVDELGDDYTVDDLVSEMENKILSITGRNSVIQIK